MKATCPRLFEVEALRDGRLQGAELAHFQTHLTLCSVCARETEALEALAEALRSPSHLPATDQLHIRRERTRLLAAFDASLMPAQRSPRGQLWLRGAATLAALSLLTALAFLLWPTTPAPPAAVLARAPDPVTIHADSHARWFRQTGPQLDKIILQSGALSIRVAPAHPPRRLLVILPDGELEDIGTTFTVSADAGQTTRVTVQEGSIVLRLRGTPPLALDAGDAWSSLPSPAAPSLASSSPPAPPLRSAQPMPAARPARGLNASTPELDTGPRSPDPPAPDPSTDFRAAMAAFNGGDNSRAAARFSGFLTQHPGDPRAQDAAYLRVLALQRSGNSTATREAARDYLTRYPRGFRRAEVEALAR